MVTEYSPIRKTNQTIYRTAIYLRLSRDDGDKFESDSISNQRKLITDYIENKSEFCLVDEYVDDGYSGSNFERPAWKQLYEDLECGAVNCIIVKDLSRFGRNYIEVGRYLQMIFPVLGVRLVAINDNFDTLNEWQNGDALTVPMKNLINDIYCKDISKKVSTQLAAMRVRGECVSSCIPYGYKRNPKDHLKLIVDENVAGNVKQIFIWKLEGYSDKAIADKLNEQGVLSPYEYQTAMGNYVSGNLKHLDKAQWARGSVYNILHNEYYKGTMVQGKRKRLDCHSKEKVLLPKEEWIRVEDTHEAIVEPELYDMVQEIMEKETRVAGNRTTVALLSGFLFCGDCGRQLILQPSYYKGKKYNYYTCKDCRDESRKTKRVSEKKAYAAILEAIRKTAEIAVRMETLIDVADSLPGQSREAIRLDGQLVQLQEEMERYARIKNGLYEDYKVGILSREEYMDYSQMYKAKIDKTKETMRNVADERKRAIANFEEAKWIKTFKKYRNITSLERPILAELLEQVLVYPGGKMEIVFKDTNFIEATLEAYGYNEIIEEVVIYDSRIRKVR
ncbi:MAG: recombinase family protein [Oscillospiraceae bacterium]|nr:recombinase family protein [Oscillospiraceae bacterium]